MTPSRFADPSPGMLVGWLVDPLVDPLVDLLVDLPTGLASVSAHAIGRP